MQTRQRIVNLRDVFCGFPQQHNQYLQFAKDFFEQDRPGIFVIGGTNLTGKTSLISRIKKDAGLTRYDFFPEAENPTPQQCFVEKIVGFSDDSGKPRYITIDDIYAHDLGKLQIVPTALEKGVKTIILDEIWAGHTQALQLIRDELVRKHDCKVVVDAVSSGIGDGFFDGEANNRLIDEQLHKVFTPDELNLHLLDFNRIALREGVRTLAKDPTRDFQTAIAIFEMRQRELLDQARKNHNLDSALAQMLGLPLNAYIENKQ